MSLGAAAIGAGGALGSSLISGAFNARQAAKAFDRSVLAYKHRYQWAVEDLRAAGLNPILAATGGMTGGAPSAQAATMPEPKGVTDALAAMRARKELALLEAQKAKTEQETSESTARQGMIAQQAGSYALDNVTKAFAIPEQKLRMEWATGLEGKPNLHSKWASEGKPAVVAQVEWLTQRIIDALWPEDTNAKRTYDLKNPRDREELKQQGGDHAPLHKRAYRTLKELNRDSGTPLVP